MSDLIELAEVEFVEEEEALLIKNAPILVVGVHNGHTFDEEFIKRCAKRMSGVPDVRLFLGHDEREDALIGSAINFRLDEGDKPRVIADLVVADKDVAEKVKILHEKKLTSNYGISPKIDLDTAEIKHVALVLKPAQGDQTKLEEQKQEQEEQEEQQQDTEAQASQDGQQQSEPSNETEAQRKTGDHVCVCLKCGHEITVPMGVECNKQTCPKCGGPMRKKEAMAAKTPAQPYYSPYAPYKTWWEAVQAIVAKAKSVDEIKKALNDLIAKVKAYKPYYPAYPQAGYSVVGELPKIVEVYDAPELSFDKTMENIYRVLLFKAGRWLFGDSKILRVDKSTFQRWRDSLKKLHRVPVFLGHPTEDREPAPAVVGWLLDIDYDDERCYGIIEIVEPVIAEAIDSGKIRGVSIYTAPLTRLADGTYLSDALEHVALTVVPAVKEVLKEGFQKLERFAASDADKPVAYIYGELKPLPQDEEVEKLSKQVEEMREKLSSALKLLQRLEEERLQRDEETIKELVNNAITKGLLTPAEAQMLLPGWVQLLRQKRPVKVGDEEIEVVEYVRRMLAVKKPQEFASDAATLQPSEGDEALRKVMELPPEEFDKEVRKRFFQRG